ncbi:hypothetical protein E2986_04725 [Frieseomelitta varia]|uniref:Selenoprotein S n=1 Tax=Frieseomelitta varia TaxID=561572 RepID=A0A833VXB5_9HYME|nr:uncharacterized protein LOC122533550 isoform X1 [Frieseomelitta varia]KAF3423779.1 hypothetical protein E2986_04725 [Frieseomelitta varia]
MDYFVGKEFEVYNFRIIWNAIASVGWYIIAVVISFWLASPYIREKYTSWKLKKDEQEYAAKYHKNPDLLQKRLSSFEASRQKMQEEYYQKSILAQQKETEQNEKAKQIPKLMLDDNQLLVTSNRSGKKDNDLAPFTEKKHKSIREEYNPLMGHSSRGYRPPKRTCCGKGGCG